MNRKKLSKSFVRQQDQSDCGVACLLSIIRFYNGNNSLENLRKLSGTSKQGTSLLGLYQAANEIGFIAKGNKSNIESLIEYKEPLILHVVINKRLQHYIVLYGYSDGKFLVGDPSEGIIYYTKEDLDSIWESKACLTLKTNDEFINNRVRIDNKRKWFLKLIKDDIRLISFSVFIGLAIAILGMAMAIFSQKLVDDILPLKDFNKLITGVALISFLLVIRVLFTALRDFFLISQSKSFNNRIIKNFYGSLLLLPKLFFETRKIGELVTRLNDTQRVQRVINTVVGSLVINLLVTLVSLSLLFYYCKHAASIAILSLPLYFFLIFSFNKRIIRAQRDVMQSYAISESNYINSMQGIATIKNYNRQGIFSKINQFIYGNFQDEVYNLGKINLKLSALSGLFSVLFLMGVLTLTSFEVYCGTMQIGELIAILTITSSLLPSVAGLALIAIPINEAKVAFDRMYEFASIEKEKTGSIPFYEFDVIEIQNLSFRFTGRSPLLKRINFSVKSNECVAIVGESGSGKSTLGQILQKFYSYEGDIILNEKYNLKDIDIIKWRDVIGVIPQEITIINGNLFDNILLGKKGNVEQIELFFKDYGFSEFIGSMPQGYLTLLGEEGINISGGQKQVIALMRVLYKKPQLLILDEFTSSMDRKTEKFVLELLIKIKSETAIVFISHRLHSINKIADYICIVENGVTSHFDTHAKLMKSKNFYSDFWT